VVGSGFMGSGIAGEFARFGLVVHCFDNDPDMFNKSKDTIKDNLKTLVQGGVITNEELESTLARVHYHSSVVDLASKCNFIIEAVFEDIKVKQEVFETLDKHAAENVILASNTSSLSIKEISQSASRYPSRVLAVHFLHPAHLIPLVEVTPTPSTSSHVVDETFSLLKKINKSPVLIKKEVPGYLAARLQAALFREALYLVEEGVVSAEDADKACKEGFGRRLTVVGPLEVADMAGLDIYSKTSNVIFPSLSSAATAPTLDSMVASGKLGAKNGSGFYNWDEAFLQSRKGERDAELLRRLKAGVDQVKK